MNPDVAKDNFFKWVASHNIGYIIRFHAFILRELRRRQGELEQAIANFAGDRKGKVDVLIERDLYKTIYRQLLMSNTFLLLYSHLEEWLFHIGEVYANAIELNKKSRGSISRFTPIVHQALHVDVSRDEKWQFLLQAEWVRNCLLHANARIDLSRDSQKLRRLLKKSDAGLSEHNSTLYVDEAYIERFFECVQYLILRVQST